MQPCELEETNCLPKMQLEELFRPRLATALCGLLGAMRELLQRVQQKVDLEKPNSEIQLLYYRLEKWLHRLKKDLLSKVFLAYPIAANSRPPARYFTITGLQRLYNLVKGGLQRRKALSLINIPQPTDPQVERVLELLPRVVRIGLSDLHLSNCQLDTSEWFGGFHTLVSLSIGYSKITEKSANAMARGLPLLHTLSISGCKELTEAAALIIVSGKYHLKNLTIENCPLVSGRIIRNISECCRSLDRLSLGVPNPLYQADRQDIMALVDLNCKLNVHIASQVTSRTFWNTVRVLLGREASGINTTTMWDVLRSTQY